MCDIARSPFDTTVKEKTEYSHEVVMITRCYLLNAWRKLSPSQIGIAYLNNNIARNLSYRTPYSHCYIGNFVDYTFCSIMEPREAPKSLEKYESPLY